MSSQCITNYTVFSAGKEPTFSSHNHHPIVGYVSFPWTVTKPPRLCDSLEMWHLDLGRLVLQMKESIRYFDILRPSDAYMRQWTNHQWFRQWCLRQLQQYWNLNTNKCIDLKRDTIVTCCDFFQVLTMCYSVTSLISLYQLKGQCGKRVKARLHVAF